MVRPVLYALLGYRKARMMADAIADLSGPDALLYCSRLLRLKTRALFLDRIPATGRCVIVGNHPTGIADAFLIGRLVTNCTMLSVRLMFANGWLRSSSTRPTLAWRLAASSAAT